MTIIKLYRAFFVKGGDKTYGPFSDRSAAEAFIGRAAL